MLRFASLIVLAAFSLLGCFDYSVLSSGPDLTTVPPQDLASEPPLCASGFGFQVGPGRWACPGPFLPGGFASLCATGAAPCGSTQGIDLGKCKSLPGFFAADVGGYSAFPMCSEIDPMNFQCTDKPGEQRYFFRFGCGYSSAANYRGSCDRTCSGFDAVMLCQQVSGGYSCKGYSSSGDRNEAENNGVLCCAAA